MKKFISKKFIFSSVLITIILFGLWFFSINFYSVTLKNQYLSEMSENFKTEISSIEISVNTAMGFVSSLEGFILSNIDRDFSEKQFEIYARKAMKGQAVKNFSIAPNNIQRFVYPLIGNEETIGHNLKSDTRENVKRDVQIAQSTGEIVISGPYELRQGGLGMVVRNPIYYNNTYWGLVNVVVDVDEILAKNNFSIIEDKINISMASGEGNLFYGVIENITNHDFVYNISIGNEYWQVFGKLVEEENPFYFSKIKFFSIAFLIILILFELLILNIIYKNIMLSQNVNRMIYNDILTELPNRRALRKNIDEYINKKLSFAIIFLDIDNFKNINDSFGHTIGDGVLKEVANKLSNIEKDGIGIFRWGGDEFIVLILRKYEKFIKNIIEEIELSFKNTIKLKNNFFNLSFSGGVSLYPEHGNTGNEIIKNSDIALHYAKNNGKRHIEYFSREIKKNTKEKLDLERKLEIAIEKNQLDVFFQPQIDYKKNKVFGVEALVRWIDEDGNFIPPSIFIPIAERVGLIKIIDYYVLDEALKFLKICKDSGLKLKLSVNFSSYTFNNNILKVLTEKQKNGELDCCDLEIEITESVAIKSYFETNNLINNFKDIGIDVALDDFGTGYSSLSYLTKLDISTIKIDRMFVKEIKNKTIEKSIVKALISISNEMNINIIAEGVENEKELAELYNINCNLYQGYYFSEPLPRKKVIEFIKGYSNNDYKITD